MANISWISTGSGNWSAGANWSSGTEPGAADDVLLGGTNAYTVTLDVADAINALTLSNASAALALDQTLSVATTLAVSAGSVQIEGGGGLSGGLLAVGAAGSATLNGGSLSNTSVDGTMVVTDAGGVLAGTLDFAGVGGKGSGTIDYNYGNFYADNYLYAQGNTTLNGATLNIGNTGTGGSVNILFAQDTTGKGATLTLGPNFTLNEVAGNSALQGTDGSKDAIVNDGTIDATTGGGALQIDATSFTNKGTIDTANGGVVFFTGSMGAALLDSVTVGTGGYVGVDGTVTGGTLVTPDGQVGSFGGSGELDGVTVHGTFTVEDGGFTLAGSNQFAGASGSGTGTLNFDQGDYYAANYLYALGDTTLNNVVLDIGNTGTGGSINILYNQDTSGTGATLQLGSAFTLNAVAGNSAIGSSDGSGDAIINAGTIDATTGGGSLQIDATKFTNKGKIETANGGALTLTGTITAALIDSITTGSGGYAGIDGTVNGGTIVTPSGLIGSAGGSGVLNGVAVHGTFTVEDGGFTLEGNNSFAGSSGSGKGTLNFDQGNYYSDNDLTALGSQVLQNVTLNIGNTGLGGSTNILFSKDATGNGVTLALGTGFTLNAVQGNSAIESTDASGDSIANLGTIDATTSGGYLQIDGTKFTNNGVIDTASGGVVFFTGTVAASLIDSVTVGTGGYVGIDGTVNGGRIITPDGQIGSWEGNGVLDGVSVQGTFTVQDSGFTLIGSNKFFAAANGTGDGTINFDLGNYYSSNYLYAQGDTGLNNVILNIGNTGLGGSTNILFNQDLTGTGATLTLGTGFTLNAVAGNSGIGSTDGSKDAIIDDGVINATTQGGVLTIDATKFIDDGTINVANGGEIVLTGRIEASLIDKIDVQSGGFAGIDGLVSGGTLVCRGSGVGAAGSSGSLSGVTVQGTLVLESNSFVITGNTVFTGTGGTGAGTVDFDTGSTEQANYLYMQGNTTLDNVVLNLGNTGQGSTNILYNDDTSGSGATLTLGSAFTLNLVQGNAGIGGSTNASDAVVNDGVINATSAGALQITPEKFTNTGTLNVGNGGNLILSTDFTNVAGGRLSGGTIAVSAGGTLDLANNSNLATLASNLSLSGTSSVLQWLDTATNTEVSFGTGFTMIDAGAELSLLAGRGLTTTNGITDNGKLVLGGGTLAIAGLALGTGIISGSGTITSSASVSAEGTIAAAGGDLAVEGRITGAGVLLVGTNAALAVAGNVAAGNATVDAGGTLSVGGTFSATSVTLSGTGDTLAVSAATSVATDIIGFGSHDSIEVTGQSISSVLWTQTNSAGGNLQLIGSAGTLGTLTLSGTYTQDNFEVASAHQIDFVPSGSVAAMPDLSAVEDSTAGLSTPGHAEADLSPVALHLPHFG